MAEQIPQARMVPLVSLTPAPWNPRSIKDPRFENLCLSLIADEEFLWQRPILALADGTVYAGNIRLRAAQHLGWLEIPAIKELSVLLATLSIVWGRVMHGAGARNGLVVDCAG